jgi:lysine 2,3-aminomutase
MILAAGQVVATPPDSIDSPPVLPVVGGSDRMSLSLRRRATAGDTPLLGVDVEPLAVSLTRLPRDPASRFRKRYFPDATLRDWRDWRWQSRNRIRTLDQLERMLVLSQPEREALQAGGTMLPVGITPYYMSLVDRDDADSPIRKTVIPSSAEFYRSAGEADDPLGEDGHSPLPGLVHRYPDRVLLLLIDFCSTYCRYCTRSRVVGHGEIAPNEARLEKILAYLREHTEIRDVLISGGDPLAVSDEKLDSVLSRLRAIPHIEFVRIGTKMPAVLPQRITPSLVRVLRKYHPLWMSVHYLHPDECTIDSQRACERLADAGIPLGSQTVLLKGVNDEVDTMKQLVHKLLRMRVRPYYLYQCDPISGSSHFRTTVDKGLEIIEGLRGHTTGYAVPTYVIDAPGGGGKIPLQPNYFVRRDGDWVVLRNFEGKEYRYPDPVSTEALTVDVL